LPSRNPNVVSLKAPLSPEEVEQYNLAIQRKADLLCNLHAHGQTEFIDETTRGINPGTQLLSVDSFNWRTAAIAFVVSLPCFFYLLFGAFELYGARNIALAALFSAAMCSAFIVFVAREKSAPRLDHEIKSYAVAFVFCLPAWVLSYLLVAATAPVHTALAVASFVATVLNLYLGGPFGEKRRRATANVAPISFKIFKGFNLPQFSLHWAPARASGQRLRADYMAGRAEAICRYYQLYFTRSALAKLFEQSLAFAYVKSERELVIDAEAPGLDIFPAHKSAKYVKSSAKVHFVELTEQSRQDRFREFLASWALRMAADALVADRAGALESVIFNAYAPVLVPETGKSVRSCLLSLRLTKSDLAKLDVAKVDKIACLRKLGARLSAATGAAAHIVAVQPLRTANSAKSSASAVNSLALLSIDPLQFENLLADLLRRMGLEASLTQASHDGGIDIVATDARPILGGKIVVQAKRYKHTVPVSAVRDLYGAMQHEGASKAILFTTSRLSPDAWQFASGKPIQLIEGDHLVRLLQAQGIAAHL